MNTQKLKDTRPGAKRKSAVAARSPSKVAKEARSPRAKQTSARNVVKPLKSSNRETSRSAASKRFSSQALVPQPIRESSKLTTVLGMLRAPGGATIADIVEATGWQQHSVRGFLAGVIRKKLELDLVSDKVDGERRYRIGKATASK
ncbi:MULTISPECIES: DUF3489 domain-containing protein [unclassified Afipia]|uniref:DUF3489 domain-containing protein n=1 Tax=unclassified Afipia TaxID=2642050 RepID=UPI0009DE7E51|nr:MULTISPECIES: DUF3489 domain-containing protein [unclassified Afipia]